MTVDDGAYDIVVIGAGPAGENLAQYATQDSALTAVLVERELVGGECSYYACIPSKALLRPVVVAATAAHLGGLGAPGLDRDALLARRDEWVSGYDDAGQLSWARSAGLDVVRGSARLVGERRVAVDTSDGERILQARVAVVIATGSAPVVPEPHADVLPWGSRDATGLREVPERLAVVGGGVVACEAATWLAALGSRVTMIVRGDRLLAGAEPFAGEAVRDALLAAGVDVRLGTDVVEVRRDDPRDTGIGRVHGGPVRLALAQRAGGPGDDLEADELLLALGRRPRLAHLGLDVIGLDEHSVLSDARPRWLHLVGDASGQAPLTHWGKYQGRVLGEQLAAGDPDPQLPPDPQSPHGAPVPQVVFTDPQVAWVGRTETAARAQGLDVVTAHVPWGAAAGAGLLRDDATGGATLVVDRDTGRVVGATFVGPDAGELLHAATTAIVGGVPVHVLRHAVPAFPTASELWLRLLEALPTSLRTPSS